VGPCCRRTRGRQVSGTHLSAAEKPQGVRAVSGATWAARYQKGNWAEFKVGGPVQVFSPFFMFYFLFSPLFYQFKFKS
jgi:hypothetical protein